MKSTTSIQAGGWYQKSQDERNWLKIFQHPGLSELFGAVSRSSFSGGKIQRSEQQLKQTEATSVKLKSCNLILHVPYLVLLISDYTILREKRAHCQATEKEKAGEIFSQGTV